MNNMRNKIFSLLVLLLTAATGAWADNYYVIGTMNDWGPSKQFQLTQNPANPAEYMITLSLKAGAKLKVIGVDGEGNWTWFPGGSDPNYVVSAAGQYTIYCRPDGQGGDDWFYHCLYLAAAPAPAIPVTEISNNTWEFTMPDYAVVANIEYDTDLELREENVNTTVLADWDGYEADVTLKRTLTTGGWNTFAVPFDVSSTMLTTLKTTYGVTVKELTNATLNGSTLNLTFDDATSIEAGKPYLVNVTSNFDFSTILIPEVVVSKTAQPFTSTNVDFIPTLGKTTIEGSDAKEILIMAGGGELKHPKTLPAYMKGFRAYFQLKGEAANAHDFNFDFGNGEATDISNVNDNDNFNANAPMYNLAGQRVTKSYKGVVIQNGQKMVIK